MHLCDIMSHDFDKFNYDNPIVLNIKRLKRVREKVVKLTYMSLLNRRMSCDILILTIHTQQVKTHFKILL